VHNTFNLTGFSLDKIKVNKGAKGRDHEIVKQRSKTKNQSPKVKKGSNQQSANETDKSLENKLDLEFKMQFDMIAQKMADECK